MRLGPGLSFSWKRAFGLTAMRQSAARKLGFPTTVGGIQRKVGAQTLRGCGTNLLIILAIALMLWLAF